MVKLSDLSHRGLDDLQFYTCVKSLVRLDLYAKAAVVCSPKRQGGWKLKKWKLWLRDFSPEKTWKRIFQLEEILMLQVQDMHIKYKEIAQHLPDEVIRQRVSMEIDRILHNIPDCRDQLPSSTTDRRLNWVGMMENAKKVEVYIDGMENYRLKVLDQAHEDIIGMLKREVSQNLR